MGSIADGGFLVHKGSGFSAFEEGTIAQEIHNLRKKLIDEGYVKNNVFVKGYVFNNMHEATVTLLGRMIYGRDLEKEEFSFLPLRDPNQEILITESGDDSKPEAEGINPYDDWVRVLHLNSSQFHALGCFVDKGFLVYKGSEFSKDEEVGLPQKIVNLREILLQDGFVKDDRFVRSYIFYDAYEAARAILGHEVSEWSSWLYSDGISIGSKVRHKSYS